MTKELEEENRQLEKEKCELLGIIQGKDKAISDLKKENERLEGCLLTEQEYTLTLEKQIEKMKCCPNCKSWDSQNLNFCEKGKRMCDYRDCEEWELAE